MSQQDITAKNLPIFALWNQATGQVRQEVLRSAPKPVTVTTACRTPAEARAWLEYQGISIAQWARENNMNQGLVTEVLKGRKRCLRGMSHNIAVLLGMKEGVITTRPGRVAPKTEHAAIGAQQ